MMDFESNRKAMSHKEVGNRAIEGARQQPEVP